MARQPPIEVIARGALVHGQRVLLCRNVEAGYFYLPGGHVDFGEPAARALVREFAEECGLAVTVGTCGLVSENLFEARGRPHHEINLVFQVEHADPDRAADPVVSREPAIAFEWVDLAAVVDTDVRPAAVKAWLASGAGLASKGRPAAVGVEWVSEGPPHLA